MTEGVTDFSQFQSSFERIADNIEQAIQGKDEVVRLSLVALVAEGHLLFEDVPGVGKTMLAKSLAKTWAAPGSASSSPPICCRATSPASTSGTRPPGRSASSRGPCSPTSVSATRSTALRRRPKARCSSAWRSGR